MFEMKNGQLYDGHGECKEASDCQLRKNRNKFEGCSGIMGKPLNHYCFYRENYPHINLDLVFAECYDDSED